MFSAEFNDIYFSTEDGLAESRHTYLAGNNLPQAWSGRDSFHIIELGFGSGLNFLATAQLWQAQARPAQTLHYTAIEKYPCELREIEAGLARWQDEIGGQLKALSRVYQPHGFTAEVAGVRLTLVCGDIADALPQVTRTADAFYLDGFAPVKNPEMWSRDVFRHLARLSHVGSTFATFTVARSVRDNATQVGFTIRKTPGYGRKDHMLTGVFAGYDHG